MLVLTRSANQSIVIDHDIVVTVLEVRGDHVRIGISAPDHIQIHRQEVFDAVQEANRQAAKSTDDLSGLGELAPAAPSRRPRPRGGRDRRPPAAGG